MKRVERPIQILLLIVIILYSQFYKLNVSAYRIWDEAQLATNAYEMTKTGNLLVTTVGYAPDMWNTKPPLMIWAQAICIKLNGLTEFSVRFPSALCATLTTVILFCFVLYVTGNGWASLLASLVLCTSRGYTGTHGTRFGEYDSMLALFTTCYLILFFLYTEAEGIKKNKFLLLFFCALAMAAMTKGVAALLFTPALLIYLVLRKKLTETLSDKYLYLGLVIFLVIVPGYYFLREHFNPGYLHAVYENEIVGRYNKVSEGHDGPLDYYYAWLRSEGFRGWFWFLPVAAILIFFNNNRKLFRVSSYCLLCSFVLLTIISIGKTKLFWYAIPLFPLFAILIAILLLQISNVVGFIFHFLTPKISLLLLFIIFSIYPTYEAFQMVGYSSAVPDDPSYNVSYYLRDAARSHKNLNGFTFLTESSQPQWQLYIDRLNDLGVKIDSKLWLNDGGLYAGQKLIAQQYETKNKIESNYNFEVLEDYKNVRLYKIISPKNK